MWTTGVLLVLTHCQFLLSTLRQEVEARTPKGQLRLSTWPEKHWRFCQNCDQTISPNRQSPVISSPGAIITASWRCKDCRYAKLKAFSSSLRATSPWPCLTFPNSGSELGSCFRKETDKNRGSTAESWSKRSTSTPHRGSPTLTIPQQSHHIRAPHQGTTWHHLRASHLECHESLRASSYQVQVKHHARQTRQHEGGTWTRKVRRPDWICHAPWNTSVAAATTLAIFALPRLHLCPGFLCLFLQTLVLCPNQLMEHHGKHTHQIRPTLPTRLYVSATAQGNLVCLTRQMKQFSVPDAQIAGIRESPEFGQGLIKGSRGSSVQNHRLNASECWDCSPVPSRLKLELKMEQSFTSTRFNGKKMVRATMMPL